MDPSAVSFQVRPVEVANGRTGGRSIAEDRQPSFGSLEQHHVVTSLPLAPATPSTAVPHCLLRGLYEFV